MRVADAVRPFLPPAEYPRLISEIRQIARIKSAHAFPHSRLIRPYHLHVMRPLETVSLHGELVWFTALCAPYTNHLAAFRQLARLIDMQILRAEFRDCLSAFAAIEATFGTSIWLLSTRIAVLQLAEGLESQKSYARSIDRNSLPGLLPYLTHYISYRNEASVDITQFSHELREQFAARQTPPALRHYLEFHLIPHEFSYTPESIADVLAHAATASLIDYYETFIALAPHILVHGDRNCVAVLRAALQNNGVAGKDERVRLLAAAMQAGQGDTPLADTSAFERVERHFSMRSATPACQCDISQTDASYPDVEAFFTSPSGSAGRLASAKPFELVQTSLSSLFHRLGEPAISMRALTKLAGNFRWQHWAAQVLSNVSLESDPSGRISSSSLHFAALVGGLTVSPLTLTTAGGTRSGEVLFAAVRQQLTGSCAPAFLASPCSASLPEKRPPAIRRTVDSFYRMISAANSGDVAACYAHAIRLCRVPVRYVAMRAEHHVVQALLAQGLAAASIRRAVDAYIRDDRIEPFLPIADLVKSVGQCTDDQLKGDLSLPILLHMHLKHVDGSLESELGFATEDFLESINASRPSQIEAYAVRFPRAHLVYFLRHICVEAVLDLSLAYQGSWELVEERVRVCRLLSKLDPDNAELYSLELMELLRRAELRERISELEQAKIYVNKEALGRVLSNELLPQYERYLSLATVEYTAERRDALATLFPDGPEMDLAALRSLALPSDERADLLQTLVMHVRDSYALHPNHGLNRYLSTRIRHGTFPNQLRQPLNQHHLTTQKASAQADYDPNAYWLERTDPSPAAYARLDAAFRGLANDFDTYVAEITRTWFQIKREPTDAGLFDLCIPPASVAIIAAQISHDTRLDTFIDMVLADLDQLLERSLTAIRTRLKGELQEHLSSLLLRLHGQIAEDTELLNKEPLLAEITASRTLLFNVLTRVVRWFTLSKTHSNRPFDVQEAINVSAEYVRTLNGAFDLTAEIDSASHSELFHGRLFLFFVDIFSTLFTNVYAHSHLEPPSCRVTVQFHEREAILDAPAYEIEVVNELGPLADLEAIESRVATIRGRIACGDYGHGAGKEGGSGFYKIHETLANDFGVDSRLHFEIVAERKFRVSFILPYLRTHCASTAD